MKEIINGTNEFLLKKASEIYNVPLDLLKRVYQLGRSEGYWEGINK